MENKIGVNATLGVDFKGQFQGHKVLKSYTKKAYYRELKQTNRVDPRVLHPVT